MARLSRLAHRIVWVNPRVAASSFSVQAGGMVAALPYCDALVSGHSFAALAEVVQAIGAPALSGTAEPPAARDDRAEPWASATPRRELGGHAERPRAEQGQHHAGMGHR